ncbi:DM13 domain-containing protein [uncultured Cocleimonas sp.]|uniref:DM13 domain-containing protein n=1 Tax=uncultured Cocleimonas sp. TaxID=1051587 RepID=UPI002626259D|nr:DM13 domain-containing protein [uncultured Cocleimonas sp.]
MKKFVLLVSHLIFAAIGFALGIYALPILTAPEAPSIDAMKTAEALASYKGEFKKDLEGSDFLHWGEGTVSVGNQFISLDGEIAPGPDYKLYLSPEFVDTEASFNQLKSKMVKVGDVKTFKNFVIPVPETINPENFNTVVVWCESFGEFISATKYR